MENGDRVRGGGELFVVWWSNLVWSKSLCIIWILRFLPHRGSNTEEGGCSTSCIKTTCQIHWIKIMKSKDRVKGLGSRLSFWSTVFIHKIGSSNVEWHVSDRDLLLIGTNMLLLKDFFLTLLKLYTGSLIGSDPYDWSSCESYCGSLNF